MADFFRALMNVPLKRKIVADDASPKKLRTDADFRNSELLANTVSGIHLCQEAGSDDEELSLEENSDHHLNPVYTPSENEVLEDAGLEVFGETDWSNDVKDDLIPIRILTDFAIYRQSNMELVYPLELANAEHQHGMYSASGIVRPWSHESEGDSDSDASLDDLPQAEQRIRLSGILEFNIHDHDFREWRLDEKIYVRTRFAWYILEIPSRQFDSMYAPFWIQHQIFHLILSAAMRNPDITYDDFVKSLVDVSENQDASPLAMEIIGRHVNETDVLEDDVNAYVVSAMEDLKCRLDVPLIRQLLGDNFMADPLDFSDVESDSNYSDDSSGHRRLTPYRTKKSKISEHRQTVVTEIVGRIAQHLYDIPMDIIRRDDDVPGDDGRHGLVFLDSEDATDVDPQVIDFLWRPLLVEEADDGIYKYYEKVNIDGTLYSVGDVVLVKPGHDSNKQRGECSESPRAQSSNPLANKGWFAKICYLYSRDNGRHTKYLFHGQWFDHGAKTILQEAENPHELFLTDTCQEAIPLSAIFQKVSVRNVQPTEPIPQHLEPGEFYYAFTWISESAAFVNIPRDDVIEEARGYYSPGKFCYACARRSKEEYSALVRALPDDVIGYSQHGVDYHFHDFVYLRPSQDGPYEIGQILDVKILEKKAKDEDTDGISHIAKIMLQIFIQGSSSEERYSEFVSCPRQLVQTSKKRLVSHDIVDGLCYVQQLDDPAAIEEWVSNCDHFFVAKRTKNNGATLHQSNSFTPCRSCLRRRIQKLQEEEDFRKAHSRLRGMELFSGAGGLGVGYDLSEYVDTRWAIESSPSAAATYQRNHPKAIVYNVDASQALQNAIDQGNGEEPLPLRSLSNDSELPPMPMQGEVDFIYGGPPCQAFSGANWNKRPDDIRSTLICNALSYLEHYNPEYFQLENVTGLLNYRLQGQQEGRSIVGGIQSGTVKFICRALIALGYQCHFKVLQAAQYGAPQFRERVIFWGTRRDCPLPEFPLPTHFHPKAGRAYKLPSFGTLPPVTRSIHPDVFHRCAPLQAPTVEDAIGDLPPFDWKNPYQLTPQTIGNKISDRKRRRELGIPTFDATTHSASSSPGYTAPVEYLHPPQNDYQRFVRRSTVNNKVELHYTKRFSSVVVERLVNIPLEPNANMTDLPSQYWPKSATNGKPILPERAIHFYRRINGKGQFSTALTCVSPTAKHGAQLHPSQRRIVSVRECARCQGFPDHYEFLSLNEHLEHIIDDLHRQIGNAVPVPLALALGQCLGAALMKKQEDEGRMKEREGSPEC